MDADDAAEEIYRAGYELQRQWSVDDLPVVEELYRKAAALGSTIAMVRLGMLLEGRTRAFIEDRLVYEGDYPQAAYWYRMAAEQGDTFAMFHLGRLYADQLDDWGAAKPWLQKAATAGSGSGGWHAREYLAAGPAGVIRRRQEAAFFDQDWESSPSNSAPSGGGCLMVIAIVGALPLLYALLTTTGRFG